MKHQRGSAGNILDRFFARAAKPSPEQMDLSRRRVWERLSLESNDAWAELISDADHVRRARKFVRPLLAGAAIAVAVALGVIVVLRNRGADTRAAVAPVATADVTHSRATQPDVPPLPAEQHAEGGAWIRSDRGTELTLADGSLVEVRSTSELAREAANDGVRIRLNAGSIIVTVAKQGQGHLFVQTRDVTVSAVGTVFLVSAEEEGSRVVVIQGEVQVQQGPTSRKLLAGQQMTTNSLMKSQTVGEAIAWSRRAAEHLVLLQQAPPTFDVASVKSSVPGETGGRVQFLPGGRFIATNVSLTFLIQRTYEVREFQVVGTPNWMSIIADGYGARYEIQAKGDASATPAQVREMVKALLAERFQLKLHTETRDLPVYALIPARNGLKYPLSKDEKIVGGGGIASMDKGWIEGANVTMPNLAGVLSQYVDHPVVDKTGFTEPFTFRLTWTPDSVESAARDTPSDPGCPASFAILRERFGIKQMPAGCPSIFTAVQEQLGLKLDFQKAPIDVLVIDHVEKPSAN
jgi:uncharacterized protein (TIGR03435 family)